MKQFSATAGATTLVLLSTATLMGQSLGELARREEARRLSIAQASKVYTNQDLRVEVAPSRDLPTRQPSNPATQPPSNPATQPPSNLAIQDEAYWHQRIDAARALLARAGILEKALRSYVNGLSNDFAARDDPAQRSVIASDRQNALLELERMQRDIRDHQKTIADIEEQARRAGVPPGWVR